MREWTMTEKLMYTEYLDWKEELSRLQKFRYDSGEGRIVELEENIKRYLNYCGENVLRDVILWSLDISTDQ